MPIIMGCGGKMTGKMNIWVDLAHIPQYNFYKPIIKQLVSDGHSVYVTYLKRGRMPQIIKHELDGIENVYLYQVGVHRMTRISVILEANLFRIIQLFIWKIGKKIDVILSNGYIAALVGWFWRVPSYSFGDDPQTIDYHPKLLFNKRTYYCIYEYKGDRQLSPKAIILPVLKEWSYLSTESFVPDSSLLLEYGVKPKEYIFLREVSVGTMNYIGQKYGAIRDICHLIPKDKIVLLSLEEKDKRELYPADWILLQEPLNDVHSLIYYSCGLVSSGDSMAREAAMLGLPSYYLGERHSMPANLVLHKVAGLQDERTMKIEEWIDGLSIPLEEQTNRQEVFRNRIAEKFIDIKKYVVELLYAEHSS